MKVLAGKKQNLNYKNFKNNEILKNYNKLNLFQYLSSDEKNFNQLLDNFVNILVDSR